MNARNYAHLIFSKSAKNIRWRKYSLFNKCYWEKWLSACRKLKLHPCLSPCTGIISKWIQDINISPENLKLVQQRPGNTLETIGISTVIFSRTQAAQQLRERTDKWDCMKFRSFCTTKEMVSQLRRLPMEWEKIFASYTSDWGMITRIYRELKKLNSL
jgi:hypothetical protein